MKVKDATCPGGGFKEEKEFSEVRLSPGTFCAMLRKHGGADFERLD